MSKRRDLETINAEIEEVEKEIRKVGMRRERLHAERDQLLKDLERPPKITDHAIVRYLERIRGHDMDAVRLYILPSYCPALEQIRTLGEGEFPIGDSHRVVVKNGVIVSVLSPKV